MTELEQTAAWKGAGKAMQELFVADPDYRQSAAAVRTCCKDTVISCLPDDLRAMLFRNYRPGYLFYQYMREQENNGMHPLPGGEVGGKTEWWQEFGKGLVAGAVLDCAPGSAWRLDAEKVHTCIDRYEDELERFAYLMYASDYMSRTVTMRDIYARTQFLSRDAAAAQYGALMEAIAPIRAMWAASGMWQNMRYELYHHYIKMAALTLTPQQIDGIIVRAKAAGMPIPADLDAGVWHKCRDFRGADQWVSEADILPECREPLTESRVRPLQGFWDVRMDPIGMPEYGAEYFVNQYGEAFR